MFYHHVSRSPRKATLGGVLVVAWACACACACAQTAGASDCLTAAEGIRRGCPRDVMADSSCAKPELLAFHEDECWDRSGANLVKEIMGLADGAGVPASVYASYTSEDIGRTLAYRFYTTHEAPQIHWSDLKNPAYDFVGFGSLQMAFDDGVASEIIAGNSFLNQHQNGRTHGLLDLSRRASVEDRLALVTLEASYSNDRSAPVQKVRPKYGYFTPTEDHAGISAQFYIPQYGNVLAVFKPEILDRLTFTNGDSLDHDGESARQVHTTRWVAEHLELDPIGNGDQYYEGQLWGELKFSEVAYLLINCPGLRAVPETFVTDMKANHADTSIYSCLSVRANGSRMILVPDQLLAGPAYAGIHPFRGLTVNAATADGKDVAEKLKGVCGRGSRCLFFVNAETLGLDAAADIQKFSLDYSCGGTAPGADPKNHVEISSAARGQHVAIDCAHDPSFDVSKSPAIHVTSATFGGNLPGSAGIAAGGNATTDAAKFCNGKPECVFKVNAKYLTDPAPGQAKNFEIHWTCAAGEPERKHVEPADATDKTFTVSCLDGES